jgi:hypothetical protein
MNIYTHFYTHSLLLIPCWGRRKVKCELVREVDFGRAWEWGDYYIREIVMPRPRGL